MATQLIESILKTNSHIGSMVKNSHSKTKAFQLWKSNGVMVIDPEKIAQQLENAKERVQLSLSNNQQILIICEKFMYSDKIEQLAEKRGIHYFVYNTPAWVLTNFDTVLQRIKWMNDLQKFIASEEFTKITKKEQWMKRRELGKVQKIYAWVKNLTKKPDMTIIVDGKAMGKFVDEVKKIGAQNIVISTTDFNHFRNEDSLVITNVNNYDSLNFALSYIFWIK